MCQKTTLTILLFSPSATFAVKFLFFGVLNCGDCSGGNYKKKRAHFYFAQNVSIRNFLRLRGERGTFLFMTFFHWVQQFPNSHLFNDPKTLMYHQEHGDFFLKYSSLTTIFFKVLSYRNHNFSQISFV